eukprot:6162322-Prymnesium_polylepis.1
MKAWPIQKRPQGSGWVHKRFVWLHESSHALARRYGIVLELPNSIRASASSPQRAHPSSAVRNSP